MAALEAGMQAVRGILVGRVFEEGGKGLPG